jgi:hypothetical protein
VAVLAAVLTGTQHAGSVSGYRWAFLVAGMFSVAGLLIGFVGLRRSSGGSRTVAGVSDTGNSRQQQLSEAASEA